MTEISIQRANFLAQRLKDRREFDTFELMIDLCDFGGAWQGAPLSFWTPSGSSQ
jgi:hypothetical protein